MAEPNPSGDDYVGFMVHGVKLRDIEQHDELVRKLISPRSEPNQVRKDGFYFSLFFLRLVDDVTSRLEERMKLEVREIVRQEMKAAAERKTMASFVSLEGTDDTIRD